MIKKAMLVIIILGAFLSYTPTLAQGSRDLSLEGIPTFEIPEMDEIVDQKIISHTLSNSSTKSWNLYKSYTNGFYISKDNFSKIIAVLMSDDIYLSAYYGAYFNLTITIEFQATTTLYHASPLSNNTHFTLGKSANMVTNLYFYLECGYFVEGNIGHKTFYNDFHFLKDGNWSYQIPTNQWEISLLKIPVLGEYLKRFTQFDFGFMVNLGRFKTSFNGFISLEPKIICQTNYLTETFVDSVSAAKFKLDTPEEVKLADINFQRTTGKNNITLEEKLDCFLETQLGLNFGFGYNAFIEFDLSNPFFELCPSKSFDNEWNFELRTEKFNIKLVEIDYQPYTIDIVEFGDTYTSKNLLDKSIIESPINFPVFSLSLSRIFSVFIPFPLDSDANMDLNLNMAITVEGKHRLQLIAPRCANINDTIDLMVIPLSTDSHITGDLDLDLHFSTPSHLFDNISLSKHNSFEENIHIPLGIERSDVRGLMCSFLPQIYDETSVSIDLGSSFKHSQLVFDLAPILVSDQLMLFNLSSEEFVQNEEVFLKSSENKITTLTVTNGTIYDQIQSNLITEGLLEINSSLQPKLYFKANLLGKTITLPMPTSLLSAIPLSTNNITGTLIAKSIQIPTYFLDKDTTAPILSQFSGYWHVDDLHDENVIEFRIIENQSGVNKVDIFESGAFVNYDVINNTLIIQLEYLNKISEREHRGTLFIELEDNKGNLKQYELKIYYDIPYTSSSINHTSSDSGTNIIAWIFLLVLGSLAFFIVKKR